MPVCIILVGLPGSGKTTTRARIIAANKVNYTVVSSDDYIERKLPERTYADKFELLIPEANRFAHSTFDNAVQRHANIIVDRTNLTAASRAKYIRMCKGYYIITITHITPHNVLEFRNEVRRETGRHVPDEMFNRAIEIPDPAQEWIDLAVVEGGIM